MQLLKTLIGTLMQELRPEAASAAKPGMGFSGEQGQPQSAPSSMFTFGTLDFTELDKGTHPDSTQPSEVRIKLHQAALRQPSLQGPSSGSNNIM